MPTLADIYSYIDSQKRRLNDTLANPGTSLQQMLGMATDQARNFNQAQQAAADEFINTKQLGGPAQQNVDRMMAQSLAPAGMTVYHGSPYRFTAFDSKKIGTGEGNQAYGHGLYVAENPKVAKSYQESLSKRSPEAIEYMNKLSQQDDLASKVAASKLQDVDNPQIAIEQLKDSIKNKSTPIEHIPIYQSAIEKLEKTPASGNLYTIDLPDEHIDKMLDWDKPISQQAPFVKQAIQKTKALLPDSAIDDLGGDLSLLYGKDVTPNLFLNTWEALTGSTGSGEAALAQHGVPGVKYFDQSSRDTQNGTRNFVVFPGNEDILKIQDINGNPIND